MPVLCESEKMAVLLPDEAAFAEAYAHLPEWRRQACDRQMQAADKRRSVAVWLLLERLLGQRGADARKMRVAFNAFGKPICQNPANVHFNLSHAGERVMAVVGDSPVGCDVEPIAPVQDELVRQFLAPRERAFVESFAVGPARDRAFCRVWTLKESRLKAVGRGFDIEPASFCALPEDLPADWHCREFDFGDGYLGCVVF